MTETKINFDIVIVVISSRGDIYNKLIEIYWLPIIEYIRCNKIPIKIILLFGKDQKVNDLPIPSENIFISDAAQSLGTKFKGKSICDFADFTNYSFQTLSPIPTKNSYFEESWVHQAESEYTLLTASNYSREFVIDLNEMKFREIESGVENKNLSGTCAKTNLDAIAIRAYQLENEFKDWAKLQQRTNY